MSRGTSNERPTSSKRKDRSEVAAPPDLKAEAVVKGLEGLVQSLGDLRIEAMLRAVEESIDNQRERKNMPKRTLTAGAALTHAKDLPNIKSRLEREDDAAMKELSDLRDAIQLAELQGFDDAFDEWLDG